MDLFGHPMNEVGNSNWHSDHLCIEEMDPEMIGMPSIIAQDDAFLAVLKPAGMPVQPDPSGDPDLLSVLRNGLMGSGIGLVHRLDRPVSGVVLFARSDEALANLNQQFKDRNVQKVYWSIVEGTWKGTEVLENSVSHDGRHHKARVGDRDEALGKAARIEVKVLAIGDRYTLVQVVPEGGAFHQIRVQLSAAGHPIKGDVKYGARRGEKDRSIALHARSIAFDHPVSQERMEVVAEFPDQPLWKALVGLMGTPGQL